MATGPNRLTSSCMRKSAIGWNSMGAGLPIPALLTRPASPRSPTASATVAAAAEIAFSSVTSRMSGVTFPGAFACTACPSASRLTPAKTWKPSAAR